MEIKEGSNGSKWDKTIPIEDCFPWDLDDYPDEDEEGLIDIAKDNGWSYFGTIGECCQQIFDEADGNLEDALRFIEYDFGNPIGTLPLGTMYDWNKQQDIFLEWVEEFHPEIDVSEYII